MTRVRKPSQRNLKSHLDTVKNLPMPSDELASDDTSLDGPKVAAPVPMEDSVELLLPEFLDADDEFGGETIDRGSRPPRPSSSRRLSPTLMKIFQRRRQQIGLSLEQIAKVSGVETEELERFENTAGGHRLLYDHAVVVMRVLGLKPNDLPGMRVKDGREDARSAADELYRAMVSGPVLTFEGKAGERFGGDVERVLTTPAFSVKVGDDSLAAVYPKGALLFLRSDGGEPQPGDVVLLRHKRSKALGLRRLAPPQWQGLAPWQPAYPQAPEWVPIGRLQVVLPRPPQ